MVMYRREASSECSVDLERSQEPIDSPESRRIVGRDCGGAHSLAPGSWNIHNDPDSSRHSTSVDESGVNRGQRDELSNEKPDINARSSPANSVSQQVSPEVSYLPMVKTRVPEPSIPESMKKGVFCVKSNSIRVDRITGSLYVYSLRYSRSKLNGDGREYFDKRSKIEEVYRAAKNDPTDHLRLRESDTLYTMDFKKLWLDTSIGTDASQPWESKNFEYQKMDGRTSMKMRIEFVLDKELTNIQENFQSGKLGQI